MKNIWQLKSLLHPNKGPFLLCSANRCKYAKNNCKLKMSYADKLSRNLSDSPVTSTLEKQHGQGIFGLFNFKKKHTNGM